jgi:hypothetical protein
MITMRTFWVSLSTPTFLVTTSLLDFASYQAPGEYFLIGGDHYNYRKQERTQQEPGKPNP